MGDLLEQLAIAESERLRIPVDVEVVNEQRLPATIQETFYRVAQESLNNVFKHADASHVWIRLESNGRNTEMTIRDDGNGFGNSETLSESGMGLEIMKERIHEIRGSLQIQSKPKSGTTIAVHWPADSRDNGGHER